MELIRQSSCSLKFATEHKKEVLNSIFDEYQNVVNQFIDALWTDDGYELKDMDKFASKEVTDSINTWMTARMKQCAAKQAISIIKSQWQRKEKTRPSFDGNSIELDSRMVDIQEGKNYFDLWIKMTSIGNKIKLFIPLKRHKHFNKYYGNDEWNMISSIRLRRDQVDFFFKKTVIQKTTGIDIGIDIGINKMVVTSQAITIGPEIKKHIQNVNRKQQKSKSWYRAITSLHNYINQQINKLNLHQVKTVVIEDLTGISNGTKKRVNKQTRLLIGHWNHRKIVERIINKCEIDRVEVAFIDPSYTSQLCRKCGHTSKSNRSGEVFKCEKCGFSGNADHLASLNILDRFIQEPIVPVAKHKNRILQTR